MHGTPRKETPARGPAARGRAPGALLLALLGLAAAGRAADPPAPAQAAGADVAVRSAVASGDHAALRAALGAGGRAEQTRKFGVTLLMDAAQSGDLEAVGLLLDAGARVGAITSFAETALAYAVRGGNPAVVGRLLAAGADVNHRAKFGFSPLIVAIGTGRIDLVRQLLAAGADPNQAAEGDAPPLHFAAVQGRVEIARALLDAGARLDARDEAGRDALALAVEAGQEDAVAFFEKATGRKADRPVVARAGSPVAEVGEVDFLDFVYRLGEREVEVRRGRSAPRGADTLAVEGVSEVLGALEGHAGRVSAVMLSYRQAEGPARTAVIVFGVREGRLVELGRPPEGTAGRDAVRSIGIAGGRLRVEREVPGGRPASELWRWTGSALERDPSE